MYSIPCLFGNIFKMCAKVPNALFWKLEMEYTILNIYICVCVLCVCVCVCVCVCMRVGWKSPYDDIDGRSVWTTRGTMLKNESQLVTFHETILVSIWNFRPICVSVYIYLYMIYMHVCILQIIVYIIFMID